MAAPNSAPSSSFLSTHFGHSRVEGRIAGIVGDHVPQGVAGRVHRLRVLEVEPRCDYVATAASDAGSPSLSDSFASCVREVIPSLEKTFRRWYSIVRWERKS